MNPTMRQLVDQFLLEVYGGTAHPHRKQVLDEFVEWAEAREEVGRDESEAKN